jgi:cell division protein ZapA (FtsZ GTPase activity inhibitor)
MTPVDVNIMGQAYRLMCKEGEERALREAASLLDKKMTTIRDAGKVKGNDRIAVMAALNLAHELLKLRGRGDAVDTDVSQKIRQLRERVERHVPGAGREPADALEFVAETDQLRPAPAATGAQVMQGAVVEAGAASQSRAVRVDADQR